MVNPVRWDNPLLAKELRTRMRGPRAFWILFAYSGILAVGLMLAYMGWWHSSNGGSLSGGGGSAAFTVGKMFYGILFTVQAILVGIITPSLTAGAISIEKEQRTFEMLSVSLISRSAIVAGKLFSAVAFIVLLLTSSLPLVSVCFLLGGVSPGEVATAYVLLISSAFLYGAVGVAASSVARSTVTSTSTAFAVIIGLFLVTLPTSIAAMGSYYGGASGAGSVQLSALNPIGAITAGVLWENYFGLHIPAWLTGVLVNGLLTVILALTAVHRLEYPRSDRSPLLRVLVAVFVGLIATGVYAMLLPGTRTAFNGSGSQYSSTFGVLCVLLLPLCLLVPIFCTDERLPKTGLRGLFAPNLLRRGEAPSGLLYTLLLTGLMGAILLAAAKWGPGRATFAGYATTLRWGIVLALGVVWGMGGVALLLTALVRNRWSAMALTMSLMVLLYAIPLVAVTGRSATGARANTGDNLLYLSPIAAAADWSGGGVRNDFSQYLNSGYMLGGQSRILYGTLLCYGVLGLLGFAGARGLSRRRVPVVTDTVGGATPQAA